jgi:inner membrane protein
MKIEIDDFKNWKHSLTIKFLLLGILGVFLLIPLEMIKSVIRERQTTSENAKKEIASQWAGQQTVSGPVFNIPIRVFPSKKDADPYITVFHLMPENLRISGDIKTEKRNRSIYKVVVYNALLNISGDFDLQEKNLPETGEILWRESYFTLGISDNRGLKGDVVFKSDSSLLEAIPGLKDSEVFSSGISFPSGLTGQNKNMTFALDINLSGSESINFAPVGKKTEVILVSTWNSPGFKGTFLPSDRTINESGFKAQWLVTNLNRNFPQFWSGNAFKPPNDSFGVDFVLTLDHYQKSLRSAKYGILFIALTFLALIFAEFTISENIYVFQYLLVSLALVLFFSLLNSLSEQIGFNFAYLIASSATIILISFFLKTVIGSPRTVLMITGLLVILYSFIFILLTLNDYAYLVGNIGLFILLGITMRLSVKFKIFKKE